MRVLIDYRPALRAPTGVGLYLHYLVRALAQEAADLDVTLFSSSWSDRLRPNLSSLPPRWRVVDRRVPVRVLNLAWHRLQWPPVERFCGDAPDIAHSPTPLTIPTRRARRIITVHDLWFLHPGAVVEGEMGRDYPRYFARSVHEADLIFTVSNTVASMLFDLFPEVRERTLVTPHGTPPEFFAQPSREHVTQVRHVLRLPETYLLYVGALIPRKNPDLMLDTLRTLARMGFDLPLVMAGDGPLRNRILARARQENLRIRLLGYVPRMHLPVVYGGAELFFLTSHDEGFGLPLLEAMASGVPVVALANGAIPEIAADAAYLVQQPSPEALAEAIRRVLTDAYLRKRIVEEGWKRARTFTWAASARRTLEGYRRLAGESGSASPG